MENLGYIKIYRNILAWEWYSDMKTKTLFLHLLLTANFKDKRWQGITIKRGQRIFSYAKLAKETGLSVKMVRTCIKKLIKTGEITCEGTSKYSIATITNYENYQSEASGGANEGQSKGIQGANKGQQLNKDKKDNNVKKGKNVVDNDNDTSFFGEEKNKLKFWGKKDEFGKGYVLLTEEQSDDLLDKLGLHAFDHYTDRLADFIIKNGGKSGVVPNHYQTILKWWRADRKAEKMSDFKKLAVSYILNLNKNAEIANLYIAIWYLEKQIEKLKEGNPND